MSKFARGVPKSQGLGKGSPERENVGVSEKVEAGLSLGGRE